jgi:hypothetical protein
MSEEVLIAIDNILRSVGASSLTTVVINYITNKQMPYETAQDKFNIAVEIITLRNIYGSYQEKLKNYATLNGLEFKKEVSKPFSNVFIGASLE